jgi:hypothetical protein
MSDHISPVPQQEPLSDQGSSLLTAIWARWLHAMRKAVNELFSWEVITAFEPEPTVDPRVLIGQEIEARRDPESGRLPESVSALHVLQAISEAGGRQNDDLAMLALLLGSDAQKQNEVGILIGTHAERLATDSASLPVGTGWWETDRTALYLVAPAYTYTPAPTAFLTGTATLTPTSPGTMITDATGPFNPAWDPATLLIRFNGAGAWHTITFIFVDHKSLQSPDTISDPSPSPYELALVPAPITVAQAWMYVLGEMKVLTIASPDLKPADLGVPDADFRIRALDFDHRYRWTGATWEFAPGDPGSKWIAMAMSAAPTAGVWALCDGSVSSAALANGSVAAVTTPNISAGTFIKSGTYAGTADPATSPTWDTAVNTDTKTDSGTTGNVVPGTPVVVQSGSGQDTYGNDHVHNFTTAGHYHSVASTALKPPNETNGGLPKNMALSFYMRR